MNQEHVQYEEAKAQIIWDRRPSYLGRIVVTDIDIKFSSMVTLMIKAVFAAFIASLLLAIPTIIAWFILLAMLRG